MSRSAFVDAVLAASDALKPHIRNPAMRIFAASCLADDPDLRIGIVSIARSLGMHPDEVGDRVQQIGARMDLLLLDDIEPPRLTIDAMRDRPPVEIDFRISAATILATTGAP